MFRGARQETSFQDVVEAMKEAGLMGREEFGDFRDTWSRTSANFSSASSGGRGSFRRGGCFQHRVSIQVAMHTFESGHTGCVSHGSG